MVQDPDALDRAALAQVVLDALTRVAPDLDPAALDPDASFRDQCEIDSVDFLNFVLALEQDLGQQIPEGDYPRLSSLNGCLAYFAHA